MDFSAIFQLRTKKYWWLDVIFYFVISMLIATVLCYIIFIVKNVMQRKEIAETEFQLASVGTTEQRSNEKEVLSYQKKISDFSKLFKNHEFASNAFVFMEKQTMPNVWFKQFNLDRENAEIQLTGESDDMESFSRQVAGFEKNEYVSDVDLLNSNLGQSARVEFNLNLGLDQKIFNYISDSQNVSSETEPTEETTEQVQE